jgi:hypothetical protein
MPARPKRITLTPTASDVNGITTTNNPAGAATMLINGVLATLASDPDGVQTAFTPAAAGNIALGDQIGAVGIVFTNPTYLSFLTASDESGKVITVNGKGPDGSMIGEQITGPNATTGYSTLVYTEIYSIHVSAAFTGNLSVGVLGNAVFATPQHVTLTASTDESGGTWIVYGLDRYQNVVSESITGPNATTITTTGNFAVVTRVDVDAAATNVTVGVDGTCESGWLTLDTYSRDFEVSMGINLGGTATYSVQHTFDDVYSSTFDEDAANQLTHASLVGQTADADGTYISPVAAVRLALTAHTSGNAVFTVLQAG